MAARLATEHLIGLGRQQIGFIGGPSYELEVQHRLAGYEDGPERGRQERSTWRLIEHGDFSNTSGADAMKRLLKKAPDIDAVFVNSDSDGDRRHGRDPRNRAPRAGGYCRRRL